MNALEVAGLKKNYAGFSLDVSFALEEGKITGFIGRNGAGKTTTIKSLLGFVHPDAGDIRFFSIPFAENEMKIKSRLGVVLGGVFGVTLMLWICIQFYIFPLNFMSTLYFLFGLCQAATGYAAWIFLQQESFRVDPADYPHIGADPRRLVVCFSRMGYVRKQALAEADRTGAAVYEIRAAERTAGTLGFWWCGRYGMHRWPMPIEPVALDLAAYDHVTICAPIWVFALAAPVRSFCMQAAGRIREADYLLVHHTRGRYENAAREMDALLGLTHTGFRTLQCHTGHYRAR